MSNATIDYSEVISTLRLTIERMQNVTPFLDAVGEYAVDKIRRRIMDMKTSPEGGRWAPWAPYTEFDRILRGTSSQGLLWDSGDLLDSIHYRVDGNIEVEIGSDSDYAVDLQEGDGGKQPGREFVGWDAEDAALIHRSAARYFSDGYIGVQ